MERICGQLVTCVYRRPEVNSSNFCLGNIRQLSPTFPSFIERREDTVPGVQEARARASMSNGGRIYEFALLLSSSTDRAKRGNFFARTKNRHNCQDFEKEGRSVSSISLIQGFRTPSLLLLLASQKAVTEFYCNSENKMGKRCPGPV